MASDAGDAGDAARLAPRSITNFIGNAVATIVVARWEGALDRERLAHVLG